MPDDGMPEPQQTAFESASPASPGQNASRVTLVSRDVFEGQDRFVLISPHGPIHVLVSPDPGGASVCLHFIGHERSYDATVERYVTNQHDENTVGPAVVRDILRVIRDAYPEATSAWGTRVGGARAAAGFLDCVASLALRPASARQAGIRVR